MSESLHEMAVRMSGGRCGKGCAGCPAHAAMYSVSGGCLIRRLAKVENADAQIDALRKWAEEHPRQKTWLDLFKEKLPDSVYVRECDRLPAQCPADIFGGKAPAANDALCRGRCRYCWNREVTNK